MKTLQAVVKSLKTPKTAIVLVETKWQHPIYKKYVKKSKSYACHVENMELTIGDNVIIREVRPMSKTKRFQVIEKVEEKK